MSIFVNTCDRLILCNTYPFNSIHKLIISPNPLFFTFFFTQMTHNKIYRDATEQLFRFKIFLENKHKIAKHNQLFAGKDASFKMAMNRFSDMLPHEFVAVHNGFNKTALNSRFPNPGLLQAQVRDEAITYMDAANVELPATIDWRTKGAVTPVKDQGHCGSCWSFSATGALEAQHFRKTGVLVSLSEQNLIDCSAVYGNNGCNGGLMDFAFKYIKENGGIDTEKSYPYEQEDATCRFKKSNVGATDKGFVDIPQGNEEKLKAAIATQGPVSVAIDASHESFQFYSEGIYNEPECSPENLDHGVLAVGYGTDENGRDFWLVKNSWGSTWGDKGYVKMARNAENQCGIASAASYPVV